MSARVYVAAPFTEWRLVREVQAEIRRRGGTVSHDWTAGIESLPPGLTDADLTEEQAQKIAHDDLEGVLTADALLFLTTETNTRGGWCELGFALGMRATFGSPGATLLRSLRSDERCRIAVCGVQRDKTVFARFGRLFADWRDALPYVINGETS